MSKIEQLAAKVDQLHLILDQQQLKLNSLEEFANKLGDFEAEQEANHEMLEKQSASIHGLVRKLDVLEKLVVQQQKAIKGMPHTAGGPEAIEGQYALKPGIQPQGDVFGEIADLKEKHNTLMELLTNKGTLSAADLQHHRFLQICKSTGYKPLAKFDHLRLATHVMKTVGNFIGLTSSLNLRQTSTDFSFDASPLSQKISAIIEDEHAGSKRLHEAIEMAKANGLEEWVAIGQDMLQEAALTDLTNAVEQKVKLKQLLELLNAARAAGFGEKDEGYARALDYKYGLERKKDDVKRKLRSLVSWARVSDIEKVKQHIAEAEEAGLTELEIKSAKLLLVELLKQESSLNDGKLQTSTGLTTASEKMLSGIDLPTFFQKARPDWDEAMIGVVKSKVAKIGIYNLLELRNSLRAEEGKGLNDILRNGGFKGFTVETLAAFSAEIDRYEAANPDVMG